MTFGFSGAHEGRPYGRPGRAGLPGGHKGRPYGWSDCVGPPGGHKGRPYNSDCVGAALVAAHRPSVFTNAPAGK
jgi:hypothetical protein